MDECKSLTVRVIFLYLVASVAREASGVKTHNATRTDLTQCKLTQSGSEYRGSKGTTGGGIRCQSWHAQEPLHKISSDIKDSDFPERSMRIAKNYCRNPTRDPKGPWCYTMEPTLIDDECGIPLCNYGECRISGTGAEYGGSRKTSVSGKKCKLWDKRHKLAAGRTDKFSNKNFPELSREKANGFCRNPNDDTGGPWCYVEEENYETVEMEYCDIPFCDDKDCLVYVRNASVYSTLTKLNETYGNITLWIKLWNPMDQQNAEARLLLSLVPIPTSSKKIAQDWRAGVEILISNAGSGQIYPSSEDEQDLESTPHIILGSKWSGIWINWGGGFISVGLHGSAKPLFMDEYKKKNTISSLYPDSFLYYGLMGTGVLWSTEFCQEACEVHTTFGMEFLRVWPLQPSNTTYDIRFNVRASKDIVIRLYQSPGTLFPCFTITIGHAETITLVYQQSEESMKQHLKDAPGKTLLDFWAWKDFTLSIFGSQLRLYSERIYGNEEVLYVTDNLFGTVRWFSVGSHNNIAHWTFFCSPESDPVEIPSAPNCIASLADYLYKGSQWTSTNEMPCIPWTSLEIPDDDRKNDLFVEGSALKAINKCRNPGHDSKGPYCYSISLENSLTVSKQYCPIRSCRSSECRTAGTANDYIGTLAVTRSGRTCAAWLSDYDLDQREKTRLAEEKKKLGTINVTSTPKTSSTKSATTLDWFKYLQDIRENRPPEYFAPKKVNVTPVTKTIPSSQLQTSKSTTTKSATTRDWYKYYQDLRKNRPSGYSAPKMVQVTPVTKTIPSSQLQTTKSTTTKSATTRDWYQYLQDIRNNRPSGYSAPKKVNVTPVTKTIPSSQLQTTKSTTTKSATTRDWFKYLQDIRDNRPPEYFAPKRVNVTPVTKTIPSSQLQTTKSTTTKSATTRDWYKYYQDLRKNRPSGYSAPKMVHVTPVTKTIPSSQLQTSKSTTTKSATTRDWYQYLQDIRDNRPAEYFAPKKVNVTPVTKTIPSSQSQSSKSTTAKSATASDWFKRLKDVRYMPAGNSATKKANPTPVTKTISSPEWQKSKSTTEETETTWDWFQQLDVVRNMGAVRREAQKLLRPVHAVDPAYFNDALYPEHSVRNASNYCRDPSRNIAGAWCYTTDPLVPQDLCDVRDCEKPEECTFLIRGHGVGRRLYVLPEHRSEGLHFSLKAWEPDQPDSITFVFTADDGFKSRYILKVGASGNEKVVLYYQGEEGAIEMVKKKTLPHLLYIGKWSNFVIKIPRGRVQIYYQGAPNPLFQWDHPEPEKAFLPIYYYYTSELGHAIGVAFDCTTRCHIENTQTETFSRILPLSIWSKSAVSNPSRLELMIRAEGVVVVPLLLFPATPGYYALTLGETGQSVFFLENTYPNVRIFHKQKAPAPLFTRNSWTNITLMWFNHTINVLWNGTQIFHYEHTKPMIFYYFSLAVHTGGWATWAANCIPSDIDGDPEDGGWSEWGPWACSASCNGGIGTRKRVCNNPEPNVKGEPCLGPSVMSGRCNTITCGDITEDTVTSIKRRIRSKHTALSVKEGHKITIPSDPDIIKAITTESPDSEIEWSHNGIFVKPDYGRLKIENHDILIKRAALDDSGVYTVTLHRVDGTHLIIKLVTLVVHPVKSVITIRETLPLAVTCHCIVLGYLYSDLKISWTIEKKMWKNYGTTLPISVNVDIVPALNATHKGLWQCIVEQDDLGFKWTTNAILVNVIGPPNWRTHLMEDELTKPIFGWMPSESFVATSALIIFLILTACIIVGTVAYTRFQESRKYPGPEKKPDNYVPKIPEMKSPVARDVKTVGTQHEEEENYDDKIVESPKSRTRSKIRRFRKLSDKPERRKLMTETDTESS